MSIETTTDPETWADWSAAVDLEDVYYRLEYLELWEDEEAGSPVGIRYESGDGTVLYPLLKVPLGALEGGEGRIDVRTAYDFGGPYASGGDPEALLESFDEELVELFDEWNVVTEFARLHPLRLEALPADSEFHADNFVVETSEGYDEVVDQYKSSFDRNVRQAERNGLEVEITDAPGETERTAFVDLYLDTMEKVGADPFYFFSDSTLERLMDLPEMSTVTTRTEEGEVAASAIVLQSDEDLFYFLGASDREYLELRPNNILFDRIIRHAAETGREQFHLGGGSEGLRRFKSQMATDTVDYHLLKRLHDPEVYRTICEAEGFDPEADAFPVYRETLLERR